MYDYIHVDEKWFHLTKITRKMYLAAGEKPPSRSTQSKRFIPKVMFLRAVARPRFDAAGTCVFDGIRRPIFIQQDNAKPHISVDDAAFADARFLSGLDVQRSRSRIF